MEALETATSYFEEALQAYQPSNGAQNNFLTTAEEAKFMRMLENILEGAFQLQVRMESIVHSSGYFFVCKACIRAKVVQSR